MSEENLKVKSKNSKNEEEELELETIESTDPKDPIDEREEIENRAFQQEEIDYKDKYVRLLSEYTNFAKQKETELSSMAKFANKSLLLKIIDILDDIEISLIQESASEETKSILNILKIKLSQILTFEGVLEIEIKIGDSFNPENCEVVTAIEDKENSGKLIQILRKGYTISDRVLRTAKVIVGK